MISQSSIVVADYPAYTLFSPSEAFSHSMVQNDDAFALDVSKTDTPYFKFFKFGSIVGFALMNHQDPIQHYNRAVKLGHSTHYTFGVGTCITSHRQAKEKHVVLEFGSIVLFEGHKYKLVKEANDNVGLEKI